MPSTVMKSGVQVREPQFYEHPLGFIADKNLSDDQLRGVKEQLVPLKNWEMKNGKYQLSIDLEGVSANSIELFGREGALELRVKDSTRGSSSTGNYAQHDVIPLRSDIDKQSVQAKYANGVLEIYANKRTAPEPRRIEISTR